ncbi:hypothetical protein C8Q77DRAFT_575789 [Trametes polyzona]|nr:hypothetical protein C8Q77DRAFT_575789 [Trametes polyzona]
MYFPFSTPSATSKPFMVTSTSLALQTEEVLVAVFRHLSPYVWDRQTLLTSPDYLDIDPRKDLSHFGADVLYNSENKRALVQCARVSRAFCPHALKVLWRTLPNLRPLERLLDLFQFSYADLEAGTPIHVSDIRTPSTCNEGNWLTSTDASCIFRRCNTICAGRSQLAEIPLGGPPSLPKLQRARFRLDSRSINRTLRFVTPTARDLTLNFDSPGMWGGSCLNAEDVLAAAARRAPALEVLDVTFRSPPKKPLPQFPNLRVLAMTAWMTPQLHQAIEKLERLELLYMKLYQQRHTEGSTLALQQRRRCLVKTFIVLTLTDSVVSALQMTDFPALERTRLEVWPHSSDASEGLRQIVDSLHKYAPALHTFVLTTRSAYQHGDRPPPRLISIIEPFLEHPVLETLSLTLEDHYAFALTRTDILAFAGAWPNIVTLHLAHAPAPAASGDPLPPVTTVLELAAACPRLETLVLCAKFDCTGRDAWRNAAIAPHPLRALFLGLDAETGSYRPDKTWRALAEVLDRCFPHLDTARELVHPAVVGAKAVGIWQMVIQSLLEIRAGDRRSYTPEL